MQRGSNQHTLKRIFGVWVEARSCVWSPELRLLVGLGAKDSSVQGAANIVPLGPVLTL